MNSEEEIAKADMEEYKAIYEEAKEAFEKLQRACAMAREWLERTHTASLKADIVYFKLRDDK